MKKIDARRTAPPKPASPKGPAQRLLPLVAIALCLLLAVAFLRGSQQVSVLLAMGERGAILLWAIFITVSAMSLGLALLRWFRLRPARHDAAALFGLGLGLAVLSAVTLLMGALGFLGNVRVVAVLMAMLATGRRDLGLLMRMALLALKKARRAHWFRLALWAVLGAFLLLNITRAYEPPWEYDCLEYHLQAPKEYSRAGRVFFLRDNVYASFPQNVEMLYLLGMEATGSPDRGALVGQMMVALLGFAAAMALRGMLAGLVRREAADAAAALFYTWPKLTLYSGMALVELPLIFYATLALWGLVWSWRRKLSRPHPRGWLLLSGMAAGAAMGVKYTAALVVFIPMLTWLLFLGFAMQRRGGKEMARRAVYFCAAAMLFFSPWLMRNFANTRNPVYPLLHGVFDGQHWDAERDARFSAAHAPGARSPENLWTQAKDALFFDNDMGDVPMMSLGMFVFVPLALMAGRRRRDLALMLLWHALLLFALWFLFTQQNLRFLEPAYPALVALAAVGLAVVLPLRQAAGLRAVVILLLVLGPSRWVNYAQAERSLGSALGLVSTEEYFQKRLGMEPYWSAMQFLNNPETVPPGAKVLFLGEARAFYCRVDHAAPTVFDTHPLTQAMAGAMRPREVFDRLRAEGFTHLYVDASELYRLQTTYRFTYQGTERLGMLDGFDWDLFGQFGKEHLRLVWSRPPRGVEQFSWSDWPAMLDRQGAGFIAVYEIR